MRLIPYILYLLLVAFYEVILRDLTSIYGVLLGLPVLLVLMVALYKSELIAMWFGFAVGLVTSVSVPELAGWHALVTAMLGVATFHVRERLNLESLVSKLLLIFGGALVYNVLMVLINGPDSFLYTIWANVLPGTGYTTVVAWVLFLFSEGRVTPQKIKAMF